MPHLVDSIHSPELLPALHRNMTAFWSPYGRANGCSLQSTAHAVWFYTGIPFPLFNGVISISHAPDAPLIFADLQEKIAAQGAPALWWIGPHKESASMQHNLAELGLHSSGEVPGMAIELDKLAPAKPLDGFTIEKVNSADRQGLWARIAATGTEFPAVAIEAMVKVETSLHDEHYLTQQRYIGFLHGTPVASAALVLEAGVAGVYAVATLPAARGQGIGARMTALPLLAARALGYRVGILQASAMGYPIYQRLGFRDVCSYHLYLQS